MIRIATTRLRCAVVGSAAMGLCLGFGGCAPTTAPPEASQATREVKRYSIDDFLDTVSYGGASFSPDGTKILVRSDATGVSNAYAIPVGGGAAEPLTDEVDAVFTQSYFPNDERFLFEMDRGGNELDHLYVREIDGTIRDLTPGEQLKAGFVRFADDDASFFAITNERDERFFDVYEYQADDYTRELIYEDDTGYQLNDVSGDGRYLAFSRSRTTNDSDIYLYDRQDGALEHLSPHDGDANFNVAAFHPDGASLLYVTNHGAEFAALYRYDIASGESSTVLQPEWDVTSASYSKSGRFMAVAINADARTRIRLFDTRGDTEVELPRLPAADITTLTLSPDESTMAFYMSRSRNPRDLFVYPLGDAEPRQLTHSLSDAIDPEEMVDPQVVRFPSYDGVEIPGILYRPWQAGPESPVPALVWVHGGPGGQSRVGYIETIQYLVNHGYAVYMINNRGSSGYGKTFYAMDDRQHGEADLGDVVASKQMLIDTGWVDPERIGIIGGSYGGYMVLAALAYEPEAFAVGVDIFGVANWLRTLESIPPWWESFREALYAELGNPETDEERLRRISPLFHADKIRRPLMVLQGANDPRVLKVESDEIVEAVRANGVPVEYVVFDDEGHGFTKKKNRREGWSAVLGFLNQHLGGADAGEAAAHLGRAPGTPAS